jgi:hypothetical protein
MRKVLACLSCALLLPLSAAAQDAFDACTVFTVADAKLALGVDAEGEPDNPKVKRPKVVMTCVYRGMKEGKPVEARVQFRTNRVEAESQRAFDEQRLQLQTKPLIINGAEAFWSGKVGQLYVRKGKVWFSIQAGTAVLKDREMEAARRLAQELVKKL